MLYVEFWDENFREWRLAKMNFIKALICHFCGKDCRIVPRSQIDFLRESKTP